MKKLPVRIPTAKGTRWHKDKSKYERREKHMYDSYEDWYDNGPGSESFARKIREGQEKFHEDYEIIVRRRKKYSEDYRDDRNAKKK